MRLLDSSVNIDIGRAPTDRLLELRLGGAPVVQPSVAQLSLGASAKSYLSNLTESSAITAVISSIGQVPQQVLEARPANHPTFIAQPESLAALHLKESQSVSQQPVVTDTPIQLIVSLSEMGSGNAVITAPLQQSASIQMPSSGDVSPSVQTIAKQHPMISIEHLGVTATWTSIPLRALDLTGISSEMTLSQSMVNNAPNLSGIGTLINLTPISTLSSLTTQPITESNVASTFDGITVSGQADAIEVLVITTSGLNPLFSRANSGGLTSTPNTQYTENGAYALEQHSIILISVQASALSEAYPL